ncbi:MAG TPA: thioredoxin-like domain-containing protein [Candidatus Limnocylindrales bacterium]|nr:thioredoxin-like domain-containing protein [Candidatus Limnocylindrales bacterium]
MKKQFLLLALPLLLSNQQSFQAAESGNVVVAPHDRDLVVLQDDKLVSYQAAQFLKVPYIILYYGAGWCPDCRRFSPTLVQAYNQQPKDRKRFEVLLISRDKTADGMLKFMKTEKMSWPALAFEKVESAQDLNKYYSGHGIPCLSVINPNGKLLLQSKNDQDATEILSDLQKLLKQTGA